MYFFRAFRRKKQSNAVIETKTSSGSTKIESLDSVRGIAALSVVFWHYASVFFPAAIGAGGATSHTAYDAWFYKTPLASLFSGSFAVSLFFILSGFVLTLRFFERKQNSLFGAGLKRYFRLMPVAFVSIGISFVVLALGYYSAALSDSVTKSPWTGTTYFAFDPNLMGALWQGIVGTFANQAESSSAYNPVLWTIYYELLGSLLVFGLAMLVRDQPKRWVLYLIAVTAFINTFFVGFIVGIIIADIYANKEDLFEKIGKLSLFYKLFFFSLAFCVGSYPSIITPGSDIGKYWTMLTLSSGDPLLSRTLLQLFAGSIIIVLVLSWRGLRHALKYPFLVALGRISYTLYAIHLIIIYSLGMTIFAFLFNNKFGYVSSASIAIITSLPVIFITAWVLHEYVEKPSVRLANSISDWTKK